MKTNFILKITALLITIISFAACKKSDQPVGSAYIQVTNASEFMLPQDLYLDGNKVTVNPLAYGESTAGYLTVKATEQQAQFKTATTSAINASFAISPENGNYYSIYYLGEKTAAYQDDPNPPAAGKAKVRFINLTSSITGNVDFGVKGGAKLSSGLIQYLATDYYTVDPATQFSVYTAGTNTIVLDIPIVLQAGKIYTIYATGSTTVSYKVVTSS